MPIKESELIKCHDSKWTTPLLNVIYKVKIMKFNQYVIQVEIAIPAISSSKTDVNIKSQIKWVIIVISWMMTIMLYTPCVVKKWSC